MDRQHEDATFRRPTCDVCHRPLSTCICQYFEDVAPFPNTVGLVILQHHRERFHWLGTARLASLGFSNIRVEYAGNQATGSLSRTIALPAKTGLLYPHPKAQLLSNLPKDRCPENLLLLDGTWKQVRKLYLANLWLNALPHFQLQPEAPSRYRIRGEPNEESLSTIEAIIQALRILEGRSPGLDRVLEIFDTMIQRQVDVIQECRQGPRQKKPKKRISRAIPPELIHRFDDLVLAYAETVPLNGRPQLLHCVAIKPASGASFEAIIRPSTVLPNPEHLRHMQLDLERVKMGSGDQEFRYRWCEFLDPRSILVCWNRSTLDLLLEAAGNSTLTPIQLKAVYCDHKRGVGGGALEQVIQREGLVESDCPFTGRAKKRLGQLLAVLSYLRSSANGH